MKTIKIFTFILLCQIFSVNAQDFYTAFADSAASLINWEVTYTRAYYEIPYPNGDIPKNVGCCTDVVIRTYRKFGIDLQKEVHEDMVAHFEAYPKLWKPTVINSSIDHRRVTILDRFFSRKGTKLPKTTNVDDYNPGDLVIWHLGGGTYHIGVVINQKINGRHAIMHNIGSGHEIADCLFDWEITGHYRYEK
jgi:uncharacterized protein YijF (DUF1287 family)